MYSGTYRTAPDWDSASLSRRGSGLGLALAANLVILLVMLGLGAAHMRPKGSGQPLVIDLVSSPSESAKTDQRTAEVTEKLRPKQRQVPPMPPTKPLDMLVLTKEEFAAADISKLGKPKGEVKHASNDSKEVGRAPNGEVLYGAEWYRRPTDVELSGYLPRNAPEGWGLVACRTAPDHRVEDCVELGNYPAGSRLASAVRQAAWQFRVRAPRKNGRDLVGAWVQIRIDYLHSAVN